MAPTSEPGDHARSPTNGNTDHRIPSVFSPGNTQSPGAIFNARNNILSPASNSQAVASESPQPGSDRASGGMLSGNGANFWYDLLSKYHQHIDAERDLHRQEVQGLKNEIVALQRQLQILRTDSMSNGGPRNLSSGARPENERSFFPDDETMRMSRASLERIRQPSLVDPLDPSGQTSPNKYAPPPPSNASVRGPLSRLASIDEHGPSFGGSGFASSPSDADMPRSPPSTAVGSAQLPLGPSTVPPQRLRHTSGPRHPESIAAAARAMHTMDSNDMIKIDGASDTDSAGRDLPDDPRLKGQLSLPHNPGGVNSRKSEEFLAALWDKVNDGSEPAVVRSLGADDATVDANSTAKVLHSDEIEEMPDEGPVLKKKPSTNFGAPLGSLGGLARR